MEMERRPFRPFAAWVLLIAASWALLQVLMRLYRGMGSFFAPLVALGVVAGAAWLQARLLRRWRVSAGAWLLATAVGALLGLLLGLRWLVADLYMVPGVTPAGAWLTAFPRLAARYAAQAHAGGGLPHYLELDGLYAGLTFGLALGAAQSVALWRAGWRALAWIPAGAAAWGVGLFAAQLLR
ncbi:MAG: hypothetical protein KC425_06050, partial [Anaerolineales bacterium]|nr:hypothetical protein [Anaerolineales bacterium]